MSPISQRFPIPTNDDDFEKLCLRLLRQHWSRPGLELFGKRGERQFGIDILDVGGENPIYAAQCKLKEETKSLPPSDIQTEVDEAKKFTPPLGRYAILTTAKVSALGQRKVREINQSHKSQGVFEVQLLTWDQLCSLLEQYSDVYEAFYGHVPIERAIRMEKLALTIKDGVQSLTQRIEGDSIDALINEARDCITKREFQFATFLLNRIQRDHGEKLNPRQKFRVLSNQGAAALGPGKADVAAKFFLEAAALQANDENGKVNEVLAYFLVGDLRTCQAKSTALRKEYPSSSRLAALWVNSSSQDVPLAALEAEISSILRNETEVAVALARRALVGLDFETAEKYAVAAAKAAPKWSQPHLVQAQVNLGRAINAQLGFQPKPVSQESALIEADNACSEAVGLARAEKDEQTEATALVLRVDIRLLLKRTDDAIQDAERAIRLNADDPGVMLALAQTRFASDRRDEAIAILQKTYDLHRRPDIAFMYAGALQNRGQQADLESALRVFEQISLSDIRAELRPTTVAHTIQCFAKKKDWAAAETYLKKASGDLDPAVLAAMNGYLAHYQDQPQNAERHALEARSLFSEKVNADTKQLLARLFMIIGRPSEALPLLQELFDSGAPAFDPKNLLTCAAKLQRDDLVMLTCERLRERGNQDWSLIEFELQYLEKYKIDVAIDRLGAFIARNPGNSKLAKLRLSFIGLRLNRPQLVEAALEAMPPVDELPVNYAVVAVQVMKYGGSPREAVDYAYRFLRGHFADIEAHQALMVSMLPDAVLSEIPPSLEVAGINSAVCYREIPNGIPTWVVLEETDTPNSDFEEVSLTSPIATKFLGKTVGDQIVLAKGQLQDRLATILQILPKYVRRYQDSMGEMQVRFGAASSVESIRIEESQDVDHGKGVEIILASVEKRAAAVANAREAYTKMPASLHWFGSQFGSNAYQAVTNLAAEDTQQIKCSIGTLQEREEAIQSLQVAKEVIVDITALATLRLLSLERVLSSAKFHFVVSERTWITLQEMLSHDKLFSGAGGTLHFKDGRHVMYEETAEAKQDRNRSYEEFIRLIERSTEIRSGPALAAVPPEKRDALEKFFGSYGAEAMILGANPESVLWTDDLVQALTSAKEFGSRRVWTQLILGALTDAGLLTADEYDDATAKLLGMEYVATNFDAASAIAAFGLASWSGTNRPAAQLLKTFSDTATDLRALLKIFVEFTTRLYREPITPETRCLVTLTFLDIFSKRPAGNQLLTSLRRSSDAVFGINAVGRGQFDKCFDRWTKQRTSTQIYLP